MTPDGCPGPTLATPFPRCRLADVLLDFNSHDGRREMALADHRLAQSSADIPRQQFRGRVLDGQQHAILAWKDPFARAIANPHPIRRLLNENNGIAGRHQHVVIQLVGDRFGQPFQRDEIEDVVVGVQGAFDFDGGAIVMAVKPFAFVALITDEMPGTKDEMILRDADQESFSAHVGNRSD